jgi:oligoendopeptidase F
MAKKKPAVKTLPPRGKVKTSDTWDLASLFDDDRAWDTEFARWQKRIDGYERFRGQLSEDAKTLAACLKFDLDIERQAERLGAYAFLRTAGDQSDSDFQAMLARFENVAAKAGEAASYIRPELMKISSATMKKFLASKELKPYRLMLERTLRYKKHTLSNKEEVLLAMQGEMATAAGSAFRQLLDADMKFGNVKNEKGEVVELGHATYAEFLRSEKRSVRKNAFEQYYAQFEGHENTFAATLKGSIQKDVYYARVRGHESARAAALFDDNMPASVYDNLIDSVHENLPAVHRYYDLRRRKMRLKDLHFYDTYTPIVTGFEVRRSWRDAVRLIVKALKPLGPEYCSVLEHGLLDGRWCDRYPNRGKQSGAFSCGSFDGDPYILMNYSPEVLEDVFTLAHEAGHSMHSYYSSKSQPFAYYDYVIFVAEVASTFNEQLLTRYMLEQAKDDRERAYLLNREIDAIRGTIIRQTMFAEFERVTHTMAEAGEPLTVASLRGEYKKLLDKYLGPGMVIDDQLSLECMRIPHFYRAFYVYKYATGLSAAIALAQRVLSGGQKELNDYLGFLTGGCSKWPLDLLRDAGVDMESPEPVNTALAQFDRLVTKLDELL